MTDAILLQVLQNAWNDSAGADGTIQAKVYSNGEFIELYK